MSAAAPLVSVIVPVYRHETWLAACLDSVLAQTYAELELVIVDDASPDGSFALAEALANSEPYRQRLRRIVCVRNATNQGAHETLNRGLSLAQGEYLFLLNSDDCFEPTRVERMLAAMQAHGSRFAFSAVHVDAPNPQAIPSNVREIVATLDHQLAILPAVSFCFLRHNATLTSGNFALHRSLAPEVGPFAALKLTHDWDYVLRVSLIEEPLYVPERLYRYRVHAQNTFATLQALAEMETEICLHRYFSAVATNRYRNPLAPTPENWPVLFERYLHACGQHRLWLSIAEGVSPQGRTIDADVETLTSEEALGQIRRITGVRRHGTTFPKQMAGRSLDTADAPGEALSIARQATPSDPLACASFDGALYRWADPLLASGNLEPLRLGLTALREPWVLRASVQNLHARVDLWDGKLEAAKARFSSLQDMANPDSRTLAVLKRIALSQRDFETADRCLSASIGSDDAGKTAMADLVALRAIRQRQRGAVAEAAPRHRLAVATCLKNEADHILEWLCFHAVVGVEHFFLYLNDCTDNTREEIAKFPYPERVTVMDVPGAFAQRRACEHHIQSRRHQVEWTAFIDADEFLFPAQEDSLLPVIEKLSSAGASAIAVNWLNFGSNGHDTSPAGLCIEAFTRRAPDGFPDHYVVKSICRTDHILSYPHPHHCETFGPTLLADGHPVQPCMGRVPRVARGGMLLNHYYTKSRQQMLAKRLRGRPIGLDDVNRIRSLEFFQLRDRNDVEDLRIQRFAAATHALMSMP